MFRFGHAQPAFNRGRLLVFRRRSPWSRPTAYVQPATMLFRARRKLATQAELPSYGVSPRSVSQRLSFLAPRRRHLSASLCPPPLCDGFVWSGCSVLPSLCTVSAGEPPMVALSYRSTSAEFLIVA